PRCWKPAASSPGSTPPASAGSGRGHGSTCAPTARSWWWTAASASPVASTSPTTRTTRCATTPTATCTCASRATRYGGCSWCSSRTGCTPPGAARWSLKSRATRPGGGPGRSRRRCCRPGRTRPGSRSIQVTWPRPPPRAGLDVRLMVPRRSDSLLVTLAARSYFDDLLAAGVKVYEYGPRMLHTKALLVDDEFSLIGSANFDHRSFRLNFELSVLFHDAGIAGELAKLFEHDLASAPRVRDDRERPLWSARLPEAVARLGSPLL